MKSMRPMIFATLRFQISLAKTGHKVTKLGTTLLLILLRMLNNVLRTFPTTKTL